jgi:hypothetical protein
MRIRYALPVLLAAALGSASCGSTVRQGRSPVYLIMDSLTAQRGGLSGTFSNPLTSDVITNVTTPAPCSATSPCPTIFSDPAQVVLRVAPKDVTNPVAPTTNNDVTVTRYHVSYRRADGRNTQGLDVPFAFDGGVTGTIPGAGGTVTLPFELVRSVAKKETPLVNLISSPTVVTTIAEVTFYGRDQTGNEVIVTGLITIDFGNFGDF